MMTIKIGTIENRNDHHMNSSAVIEASGMVSIHQYPYQTEDELRKLIDEHTKSADVRGEFGKPFWEKQPDDKMMAFVNYYSIEEHFCVLAVVRGEIYVMQNGKTVDSLYVKG